jgi:ABC-type oligopeptide transport system substrate-binding subunit
MKNIKKLLFVALVFSFTVSVTSCASNHGYKKGKKTKKKRGCNCPSFSADVINWDEAVELG